MGVEWLRRKTADVLKEVYVEGDVTAGSPREEVVGETVCQLLENAGFDVRVHRYPCLAWEEVETNLYADGEKIDAVLLPYSPSCTYEGPVVYTGIGLSEYEWRRVNPEGRAVLLDLYPGDPDEAPWQYWEAVSRGASLVIFADYVPGVLRKIVITSIGDYSTGPAHPIPVAAVAVRREDGERLKRCRRIRLEARARHAYSHTAVVEGLAPGRRDVVISAHYDKWLGGVADDLLGVAMAIALGESLVGDGGLRVVSFGAEESGALGYSRWYWIWGSRKYVEELCRTGGLEDILCVVNLDVVAGKRLTVSATGPEFLHPITRILGADFGSTFDLPYFDSFSFSSAGVAASTVHNLEGFIDLYHTDKDLPCNVNWCTVEKGLAASTAVLRAVLKHGCGFMDYGAWKPYLESAARRVAVFSRRAAERIRSIGPPKCEEEARAYRRALILPLFEGGYLERVGRFTSAFAPALYSIEDLRKIAIAAHAVEGGKEGVAALVLSLIPSSRRVPGSEKVLPSVGRFVCEAPGVGLGFIHAMASQLRLMADEIVEEAIRQLRA